MWLYKELVFQAAAYGHVGPVKKGAEDCLPQLSLQSCIVSRRREAFLKEIQPPDTFGRITTKSRSYPATRDDWDLSEPDNRVRRHLEDRKRSR